MGGASRAFRFCAGTEDIAAGAPFLVVKRPGMDRVSAGGEHAAGASSLLGRCADGGNGLGSVGFW